MMIRTLAALLCSVLLLGATMQARAQTEVSPCAGGASRAFADISDTLTAGSDADVLTAALAAEKRLRACGAQQDSISAELIAADAYGDTSAPAKRCAALNDAHKRLLDLKDSARAALVGKSAATCR